MAGVDATAKSCALTTNRTPVIPTEASHWQPCRFVRGFNTKCIVECICQGTVVPLDCSPLHRPRWNGHLTEYTFTQSLKEPLYRSENIGMKIKSKCLSAYFHMPSFCVGSEVLTVVTVKTTVLCLTLRTWRWRRYVPPKRWALSELHRAAT
jgi:hypothetical protein